MRTGVFEIEGKKYCACLSTRVIVDLENRNGRTSDEELNEILGSGKVEGLIWLLQKMIAAGDRYCKKNGIDNPGTLTMDDLLDGLDLDGCKDMIAGLIVSVSNGSKSEVETVEDSNSKNA